MAQNQYTPPSIPFGSFEAVRHYSPFLGAQAQMMPTWRNGLSGDLPTGIESEIGRVQSADTGMPIVRAMDLTKGKKGDRIRIDRVGQFSGKPVMNDRSAKDRKEAQAYVSDQVTLSLYTHNADPGGIMTRQRNPHDTRMAVVRGGLTWINNLEDNLAMVHAAGLRGAETGSHWIVPLQSDPEFQEIVGNFNDDTGQPAGNALLPPTRSRYSCPGSATGLNNLGTSDVISLDFLTRVRARINTSQVPMQYVNPGALKNKEQMYTGNSGLYIGLISEEQYVTLKTASGDSSFTAMVNAANTRMDFNSHPAFADLDRFLWAGIIWLKCPRSILINVGDQVQQYNPTTGVLETVTAAVRANRGLILGGQALAAAYGDAAPIPNAKNGGMSGSDTTEAFKAPYAFSEDVEEGGHFLSIYHRMMCGYKKLRYVWNGVPYDNGVYAFDTYQPGL
jgi:hypothetical protein